MERSAHSVAAFARNVAVSLGTHVGSTFAVLAVTPIFVSKLGLEAYGLWALLSSVVRYGFLADFGLGPTITKFVAEYIARDEKRCVRELATFGFLVPIGVGIVAYALCWFAAPSLLSIFRIPASLHAAAPGYLCALTAYLFLFMASNVFTALLKGYGRLDVSATGAAIGQFAFAGFGALFVLRGFGVPGLLYAVFLQVAITSAFNYAYLRRNFGPVFYNPFALHSVNVRELFKMSGWIQLSVLTGFASAETDTLVVGAFVGVSFVAILDIGSKLARALLAIAWHFNNALLPALSALDARSGSNATGVKTAAGSRYLGLISMVTTGFLIAAAPLILRFWLGKTVGHTELIVLVMATMSVAFIFNNVIGVALTALRAIGKPRLEATCGAVGAVTKLAFVLALAPRFGLPGVLAGTVISTLVGTTYFIFASRPQSIPWTRSVRGWLPKVGGACIASAVAVALVAHALPGSITGSRSGSLAAILVLGVAYLLAVFLGLRAVRFFEDDDLDALRRIVPSRFANVTSSRAFEVLFTPKAAA